MDRNRHHRECAEALALDLFAAYGIPHYDPLEQKSFFSSHKADRRQLLQAQGVAASLLLQTYLGRLGHTFDTPWHRGPLALSEWQTRVFAEILERFPKEFAELFYELDNSRKIDQRQFLTLLQVALQHTFDHVELLLL